MKRKFTVILEPCEEEPGFVATVPALPGCVTQGTTEEEALANVRDAIVLWIRDSLAHNEPIPADEQVLREVYVAIDSA